MSKDKVWQGDHARITAQHEDWAQAAAGRAEDNGQGGSAFIAQLEAQLALVHATLLVAENLERIYERLDRLGG